MTVAVRVYASKKVADCYLYVLAQQDLEPVPEDLRKRLGPLRQALELELHAGTRLARASTDAVLEQLDSTGFYLQLPPPPPS